MEKSLYQNLLHRREEKTASARHREERRQNRKAALAREKGGTCQRHQMQSTEKTEAAAMST